VREYETSGKVTSITKEVRSSITKEVQYQQGESDPDHERECPIWVRSREGDAARELGRTRKGEAALPSGNGHSTRDRKGPGRGGL
jgi:hypothetical protein